MPVSTAQASPLLFGFALSLSLVLSHDLGGAVAQARDIGSVGHEALLEAGYKKAARRDAQRDMFLVGMLSLEDGSNEGAELPMATRINISEGVGMGLVMSASPVEEKQSLRRAGVIEAGGLQAKVEAEKKMDREVVELRTGSLDTYAGKERPLEGGQRGNAESVGANERSISLRSKRDIYVGKDAKSINEAIKIALPGDTIHLEPKVYREYAGFYDKKGEPGFPITLDGHGATLEGSDPLDPEQWKEVGPGLFAAENLLPRLDDAIIARWFFLFHGRMNLMGRTSKGKSAPLKPPADLLPGEWTFVKDPEREKPPSKQIYGTFFIKLAPGHRLVEEEIFVPVRSGGVQFGKNNAHLVIKNITATHPYNDGFNIHGDCRDVVFENIRAIECGDDGISAHESARYSVDGFVSIGNSTGITDTGTAQTSYNHVFIAKCVGFDVFFLDEGSYTLTNALIFSSSQNAISINGREKGECRVKMENVLFRRSAAPYFGLVSSHAVLEAKNCTFENMEFKVTGTALWDRCLINGKSLPEGAEDAGANQSELIRMVPPGF